MEQAQIDQYIITNAKYFPEEKIVFIKEKLKTADNSKFTLLNSVKLKDPMIMLILSLFLGWIGVDRFMIGDVGLGIVKLLTFGGCGIWSLVDWFIISKRAKEKNFNDIMQIL